MRQQIKRVNILAAQEKFVVYLMQGKTKVAAFILAYNHPIPQTLEQKRVYRLLAMQLYASEKIQDRLLDFFMKRKGKNEMGIIS